MLLIKTYLQFHHRGHLNKSTDAHVFQSTDIDEAKIENAYQRLKEPLQKLVKKG